MPKPKYHVFICQNERPPAAPKPSCGSRGGREIAQAFAEILGRNEDLWGKVAVTGCGCLGPCFEGPSIVVYPEGTWYAGVRPEDVEEIVNSHLREGTPVKRLVYNFPD